MNDKESSGQEFVNGDEVMVASEEFCSHPDGLLLCESFTASVDRLEVSDHALMLLKNWEEMNLVNDDCGMSTYGSAGHFSRNPSMTMFKFLSNFSYSEIRGFGTGGAATPTRYLNIAMPMYAGVNALRVQEGEPPVEVYGCHIDIVKDSDMPVWISMLVRTPTPPFFAKGNDVLFLPTILLEKGDRRFYQPRVRTMFAGTGDDNGN